MGTIPDVPQKVADELGLQRPEIVADLVALTRDGDYRAIQCKFHQDRSKNVDRKELATFFSITEHPQTYEKLSHRIVATSANGISEGSRRRIYARLGFSPKPERPVTNGVWSGAEAELAGGSGEEGCEARELRGLISFL